MASGIEVISNTSAIPTTILIPAPFLNPSGSTSGGVTNAQLIAALTTLGNALGDAMTAQTDALQTSITNLQTPLMIALSNIQGTLTAILNKLPYP